MSLMRARRVAMFPHEYTPAGCFIAAGVLLAHAWELDRLRIEHPFGDTQLSYVDMDVSEVLDLIGVAS